MTQYKDIATSQTIPHLRKLDIFGNVVKEQMDCCNEQTMAMEETNGYSAPISVTKGTGSLTLTTSMVDDFNTGLVTSQTDERGEETTITYDSALRTDVVTSPTGATQDAGYNDSALTSTQTMNWTEGLSNKSATTTYTYDGWGRVKSVVGPNGGQVNTTYDSMGRVWKQTNPFQSGGTLGAETVNTFDALGRTTVVTLPDNQTVQTAYSGNTVTVTDQVNRKMKREADGLGRLVKVYEQTASGGTPTQETSYTYDLMDRLVEVNQGSQLRKYKYDSMGRLLFEKIPEQTATINDGTGTYWTCKYTWTDYNAVASRQDARGVVTSYSYDDLRRMTGVSYNVSGATGVASTPSVTYSYDTGATSATKGLPLSVSISGQSSESYSYDTDNRLSSLTRTIGTKNYATSYQYTTAGQLTQLTYPSTRAVNINHDSIGRLSSVVNNSDSANYLSGISYNSAGQTTGWTLGSNIAESFGYDSNRLQMTSQTVTQSGSTRLSLSYSYAASAGQMGGGSTAGNAGQLMSVSGSIGGQTESAAYTYDNVGRLVTSNQTSNGVSAQRRFVYDRWGNRSEVWNATSGGSQIQSVSLEQSGGAPTNRITSVTEGSTLNYSYDAAGNVTSDGVHSYTYDAENRVVSVDGGTTATYSYDHENRRVKKVVGSTTTHYVWQGGQVIAEHNGSTGAVIVDYIFAGGRMIAREQSGRVFFLYDRLSARATITDGQGGIQGRQSHLPFGEELNATGTTDKHKFTSYERDSETGTDYAVNRQHSQSIGRFNRPDPHEGSYQYGNPQSLNRYSYVANDPVNATDPLGLLIVPGGDCYASFTLFWFTNAAGQITGIAVFGVRITCYVPGGHSARPELQQGQGRDRRLPLSRYLRKLNKKQLQTFQQAVTRALEVTGNGGCDGALSQYGIPSLRTLVGNYELGVVDDAANGGQGSAQGNVFAGEDALALVRWRDGNNTVEGTVHSYFDSHRQDNAVAMGNIVYFGPRFFGGANNVDDRAVTVLHEAVHAFGNLDDDRFGRNQDEGSRALSDLIRRACFNN